MEEKRKAVSFDDVEQAASQMLSKGVTPSVRSVQAVIGGKRDNVAAFLRDFFEKRDLEVSKMADELGSSEIAKLLAGEIRLVVDRKTASLSEIIDRQKAQINELVELMEDTEKDAKHQIELSEVKSAQAIEQAKSEIDKHRTVADNKIDAIREQIEQAHKERDEALGRIEAAEQKARILVDTEKEKSAQLDQESKALREQVKLLSVDEAKREFQLASLEQMKEQLDKTQDSMAENKTLVVQLSTEKISFEKEVARLTKELAEAKDTATDMSTVQAQFIETQKQLATSQQQLSMSERERESLSQALAVKKSSAD